MTTNNTKWRHDVTTCRAHVARIVVTVTSRRRHDLPPRGNNLKIHTFSANKRAYCGRVLSDLQMLYLVLFVNSWAIRRCNSWYIRFEGNTVLAVEVEKNVEIVNFLPQFLTLSASVCIVHASYGQILFNLIIYSYPASFWSMNGSHRCYTFEAAGSWKRLTFCPNCKQGLQ